MTTTVQVPLIARIVKPYIRRELPGWGKVYNLAHLDDADRWTGLPAQVVKGKLHGQMMELHLSDWSERFTYFLGRYYDLPTQLVLQKLLRRGDHMVDIGANIGMISLYASHLVGPEGVVTAFEPNPLCCARIQSLLERNQIHNVTLLQKALAERPGRLELRVNPEHTGTATLAPLPSEHENSYSQRYSVEVQVGDAVLGPIDPVTLMKIDVEGFELNVLKGCQETLQRWKPAVITEAVSSHLERAGSSLAELFGFMHGQGFIGYQLLTHARMARHHLSLKRVAGPAAVEGEDILWLHPEAAVTARIDH